MSLVLEKSGGVRVGITRDYEPDLPEGRRPERVLQMMQEGDWDVVPFEKVITDVRDALTDPVRKDGAYATAVRGYIGSMTVVNRGSSEDPALLLQSREGAYVEAAFAAAENESSVVIDELLVDPRDFARLVPYVMTGAMLEPDDPRLALVEEFRN